MESALYGIFARVVYVSEISIVRRAHLFDFWYKNNSCVNTIRPRFPWSILYFLPYWLCQMYGNLTGVEIQVQERRQKKFRRCLFTLSMKREIRHFHVVVVQKRRRNQAQKSVIHVQSCCFAYRLNLYIVLLTLSLRSCRWIFKSLMFSAKQEEVTPFDVLT